MNAPARPETATATVCRQPLASPAHCPLTVLTLRAWARATLWQAGDLDLHEAVDMLQTAAVRDGVVAKLAQDRVQQIMAAAFAVVRDNLLKFVDIEAEPTFADDASWAPGWRDAAVDYQGSPVSLVEYTPAKLTWLRSLLDGGMSLDRVYAEIRAHHEHHHHHGAALSTIEALMFGLRERDTKALAEPKVRGRISQLSKEQIAEVAARLRQLEPHIAKAWTADETQQLIAKWGELHRD